MRWLMSVMVGTMMVGAGAQAQTLERIEETGAIKLGYRSDAMPFSFTDRSGQVRGYSIDLCNQVADEVAETLGMDDLAVELVEVGTADRFDAIRDGTIDILCGATTVTLGRRESVDFSLMTFVTGATVLYRVDGPASFEALAGQRIGVRGGTTTEEGLEGALQEINIEADIVPFDDHDTGIDALNTGEVDAYFADRALLIFNYIERGEPAELVLSNRVFSHEPYALALAHGDDDFRLVVDRALSNTFASDAIERIYAASFGNVAPTELLRALYRLNSLPN